MRVEVYIETLQFLKLFIYQLVSQNYCRRNRGGGGEMMNLNKQKKAQPSSESVYGLIACTWFPLIIFESRHGWTPRNLKVLSHLTIWSRSFLLLLEEERIALFLHCTPPPHFFSICRLKQPEMFFTPKIKCFCLKMEITTLKVTIPSA